MDETTARKPGNLTDFEFVDEVPPPGRGGPRRKEVPAPDQGEPEADREQPDGGGA